MISPAVCRSQMDLQFRSIELLCNFETHQTYVFVAESEESTEWVETIHFNRLNAKSKLNVESKGKLRKIVIESGDMEVCKFIKVPSSVEVTVA
jgi:hypothetical protein